MALTYVHNFDEISSLNLEKDYLECSHSDNPSSGDHVSYKLKISDLYDMLSTEIQKLAKVNKVIEVNNDDVGQIYYSTLYNPTAEDNFEDLLSGNTIPLCKIGGKDLILHYDPKNPPSISQTDSTVDVYRADLVQLFAFAIRNKSKLLERKGTDISVINSVMNGNYVYNTVSSDIQYDTISSVAPVLSGFFPSGNKPMGVAEVTDLIGGCMSIMDEEVDMYVSKQSASLKNGMSYVFNASKYSETYGKEEDNLRIFTDSVDYVPYMVIKSDTIKVEL